MTQDLKNEQTQTSFDPRRDGFVHTAEARVHWRPGIDIERSRSDRRRVTEWSSGINESDKPAVFRFNPNNERIRSPFSGDMVKLGNCRSLADFESVLTKCANEAGFEREDIEIMRTDFAIDYYDGEGADYFQKLCDLMIAAFVVRHDVGEKHQHWSETIITRAPKSNKATWGQITLERYNKAIQQPEHGALWRLEMRYKRDDKHPEREQLSSVEDMLEAITEELRGLPAYYEAAQKEMNSALLTKLDRLQIGSTDILKVNQYLYQNNDRIFSRAQVRQFFERLGAGEKSKDCANRYSRRYEHLYISKGQFEQFIEYLLSEVQKWVNNDPSFFDFLQAGQEKGYAYGVV